MKIHERCSSIDRFIDLPFLPRKVKTNCIISPQIEPEYLFGATTGLPSHNSTSQGVWKNPCVDSHKKQTQMNAGGYWYTSGIHVCLCISTSQGIYLIWCWMFLFIEVLYRGDQSLRKDRRYLSGTCRSSCMTLAAGGFLRTSTLGLTWSRCWWKRWGCVGFQSVWRPTGNGY